MHKLFNFPWSDSDQKNTVGKQKYSSFQKNCQNFILIFLTQRTNSKRGTVYLWFFLQKPPLENHKLFAFPWSDSHQKNTIGKQKYSSFQKNCQNTVLIFLSWWFTSNAPISRVDQGFDSVQVLVVKTGIGRSDLSALETEISPDCTNKRFPIFFCSLFQ